MSRPTFWKCPVKVAIFCEDDFDSIVTLENETAFEAFSNGFTAGANAYGGGKWRLYLLPRDEAEMNAAEHVGEIMTAWEAMNAEPEPT